MQPYEYSLTLYVVLNYYIWYNKGKLENSVDVLHDYLEKFLHLFLTSPEWRLEIQRGEENNNIDVSSETDAESESEETWLKLCNEARYSCMRDDCLVFIT